LKNTWNIWNVVHGNVLYHIFIFKYIPIYVLLWLIPSIVVFLRLVKIITSFNQSETLTCVIYRETMYF